MSEDRIGEAVERGAKAAEAVKQKTGLVNELQRGESATKGLYRGVSDGTRLN